MMLPAHTAQAPGEECGSMMQAAELAVLDWLQAHLRCDFLDAVMPWISRICDHGEIWILLAAVLLLLRKHRWTGMSLSFALILDLICCNIVLKPLVGRIRPFLVNTAVELLTAPPADASFPSGHTAASFAAVFALRASGSPLWKPALVLAAGIAFSRLYLYVHWPTDVLGAFWLAPPQAGAAGPQGIAEKTDRTACRPVRAASRGVLPGLKIFLHSEDARHRCHAQ